MNIETTIITKSGSRVFVASYEEDGGCWLTISTDDARINVTLTVKELNQLVTGLQAIQEATK